MLKKPLVGTFNTVFQHGSRQVCGGLTRAQGFVVGRRESASGDAVGKESGTGSKVHPPIVIWSVRSEGGRARFHCMSDQVESALLSALSSPRHRILTLGRADTRTARPPKVGG